MKCLTAVRVSTLLTVLSYGDASASYESEQGDFMDLHDAYLAKYKPLWLEAQSAWWEANITGSDAAFERKKKADKAVVELHSDRDTFARIESLKKSGKITDPVQARLLDVMYRNVLPGQADKELQKKIIDIEASIEQTFNTHRSKVGDKTLTENQVREVLGNTHYSAEAERAWKAYMKVGTKVESHYRQLVKLRNRLAAELGFRNYHELRLTLQEIDGVEFLKLFDELDDLTREPFAVVKREIDQARAEQFGIKVSELRPWHFGDLFFQEVPDTKGVDLDDVFKDVDIVELTKKYYAGIGLPCDDILARSDLYEKEGKSPHAFCHDMNREGDIRVLGNIKPTVHWADTMLHEIGHGVYDKYIRTDLPFLLRTASHSITTEGIAMMFGAMAKNADWLARVRELDEAKAAAAGRAAQQALRSEKLLFSRWTQVMVRFEHGMYSNPDQDPRKLWWDLKRKYQLLSPPDSTDRPDYAAKMHVLMYPVYYHSYLMGDLFAAQVRHHMARNVLENKSAGETCFYGEKNAGDYLRKAILAPGNLHSWNELIRRATGEPLTAKYFAEQFVN